VTQNIVAVTKKKKRGKNGRKKGTSTTTLADTNSCTSEVQDEFE
jgi:hypothetical protein